MIIGIHQPQYLPWTPYFLKILKCDLFIILDTVSFQKNGIQNRNKIMTPNGDTWLTVPVSKKDQSKIINTEIDNSKDWKKKHLMTINQSYSKSRFLSKYIKDLESIYEKDWENLSELNNSIIRLILGWMEIKTEIIHSSDLEIKGNGSRLIFNLCKHFNAETYLSGVGGKEYLNINDFEQSGIEISFLEPCLPSTYHQVNSKNNFRNDLSVIDLLFNCGDNWINYVDV